MSLRPKLTLLAALAMTGACGNVFLPGGNAEGNDLLAESRAVFASDVEPLAMGFCGQCHALGDSLDFLTTEQSVYETVLAWPGLVQVDDPSASRLLTKGVHTGPAWTGDQAFTVRAWIDLEARARSGGEADATLETPLIAPVAGANEIALDGLGLAGSRILFNAEPLSSGLFLSDIRLAGGNGGAHIVHPVFVMWSDDVPSADPADSFAGVEADAAQNATSPIGGGLVVFSSKPELLSILIEAVGPSVGGGPDGPLDGCLDVASFTQNARGQLLAECTRCHAGGVAGATNAVDMTRVNDLAEASQAFACGQILSRINLQNLDASGLFVAVSPNGNSNHPVRLNNGDFAAFRGGVGAWAQAEQNARNQ